MSKPSTPNDRAAIAADLLDAVFGALAHPARRRILVILHARGGTMSAGEIADRFRHSWPTTTRHLGVLETAGLLVVERAGRHRRYGLTVGPARAAVAWIAGWAAETGADGRPDWADLPYATMLNATPAQP